MTVRESPAKIEPQPEGELRKLSRMVDVLVAKIHEHGPSCCRRHRSRLNGVDLVVGRSSEAFQFSTLRIRSLRRLPGLPCLSCPGTLALRIPARRPP